MYKEKRYSEEVGNNETETILDFNIFRKNELKLLSYTHDKSRTIIGYYVNYVPAACFYINSLH